MPSMLGSLVRTLSIFLANLISDAAPSSIRQHQALLRMPPNAHHVAAQSRRLLGRLCLGSETPHRQGVVRARANHELLKIQTINRVLRNP